MAFKLVKCGGQSVPLIKDYMMADGEGCTIGEGLTLTSGRLTKTAATATPDYIAEKTVAAATTSTEKVPIHRVKSDYLYETVSTGQIATAGAKYTIHTDGLSITTTTSSGVFKAVYTDNGTASKVRGRF